jgi:hypothetical protein
MHGDATAMCSHSNLVRCSEPVYVTLDSKCWLACRGAKVGHPPAGLENRDLKFLSHRRDGSIIKTKWGSAEELI